MHRRIGILLLLAAVFTAAFSLYRAQPPAVVKATAADTVFSAERAFAQLVQIARAPHPTGSAENARVRSYIEATCKSLGLATTVQNGTAISSFRSSATVFAGNVYNIIARLEGRNADPATKSILVMAHYDSHPNTLAAGDDGAAVAAMLETMRILKKSAPLANDVVFLFTDGEEVGLSGAKAFLEGSGMVNEIGLVLNFEARGSGGVSNMFEVNNENGWVVRQFARAAAHPFANSLSFEVYKLLPNDTDYTLFKQKGITGLNHAFIEHLEDYHSMTDTPENLDQRSLQHHGANMLSLVKHFGNLSLTDTKAPDITYFNIIGSWLVYYPAVFNTVLVLLVCLLYALLVVRTMRQQSLSVKSFVSGILLFLGVVIAVVMMAWLVQKAYVNAYPEYTRFYENNGYNSSWYFLALTAAAVGIFSAVYGWAVRRAHTLSLYAGALLMLTVLMILMYLFMPTATYLFGFSLFFALIGLHLSLHPKKEESSYSWRGMGLSFLFALPAIVLFTPVVYSVYIAFGLGNLLPGGPVLVAILCTLLLPLFTPVLKSFRWLVPVAALILFLLGILMAEGRSSFSPERPLQSNLWYLLDADAGKASWISDHTTTDRFNRQYLKQARLQEGISRRGAGLVSDAAPISVAPPTAHLISDSTVNGNRVLRLQCRSPRGALSMTIAMHTAAPLVRLMVDGKPVTVTGTAHDDGSVGYAVQYYGLAPRGVDLLLEAKATTPVEVTITDRSMGLPGIQAFPKGVIPGEGRTSNTTQVKKAFRF